MNEIERALQEEIEVDVRAASERALRRAEAAGVVDLAYAHFDSPLGGLLLVATKLGLVTLAYVEDDGDRILADLAHRLSPRILLLPRRLDRVRRELDEYFSGRRTRFEQPLDWSLARGFTEKVLRATALIPYGQVLSYREVATRAGNERAVRAAGRALASNRLPIVVPCHRVVRTGGGLGGYTGGLAKKEFLLELEGAPPGI